MYRYFTIFIFLCALATGTKAQSFAFADSLFEAGDYELAAVEYERCVYLSESRQTTYEAWKRCAQSYKMLGRYDKAGDALECCVGKTYSDYLQLALYRYLGGYYETSSFVVERCEMLFDTVGEDMYLIKMLALNEQELYDSARVVADSLVAKHFKSTGEDIMPLIDSLYALKPRLKSETLGWYLSLVPGLGHVYAGQYGLGAAALLMNVAALGFGVWQALEGCYITAYLGGAGLLSTTYPGAMRSATHYIKKANYKRTSSFNNGCKEALINALH